MQKMYRIYKITNKLTGKSYVGQTAYSIKRRFTWHKSRAIRKASNSPLHIAIREYGAENFTLELLDDNISGISIDECERFWIKKLNTRVPYGYNAQGGGKNTLGSDSSRYGYSSHGKIVMCDIYSNKPIKTFSGVMDAERFLRKNGKEKANHWPITKCCQGRQKTAYGYKWKFDS